MNRITAEEVVEAYRETNIIPTWGDWGYVKMSGDKCGCALTAISACRVGYNTALDGIAEDCYEYLCSLLDCSEEYLMGFVHGFDSVYIAMNVKEEDFVIGYQDGQAARVLVMQELDVKDESDFVLDE